MYVTMYVCIYVCMIVCMYIYVCMLCMYVCMYVCIYICMYVCMYVCLTSSSSIVTTRKPREDERDGADYNFVSVEHFKKMDKNGELLESGIYENNYYGTPKPPGDPPSQNLLPTYSRSAASSGYSPRDPSITPSLTKPLSQVDDRLRDGIAIYDLQRGTLFCIMFAYLLSAHYSAILFRKPTKFDI